MNSRAAVRAAAVIGAFAASAAITALAEHFSVSSGQIIAPTGQVWRGFGIDLYAADVKFFGAGLAATLRKDFPRINLVRIAGDLPDPPSAYAPFVNAMATNGVAVVIEHHAYSPAVLTGTALAQEVNWYQAMARAFAGNPWVLFGTMNEPASGDAYQIQATYNALRAAGFQGVVFLEAGEGAAGIPGTFGATSVLSAMHDVAWDLHTYNWESNYSTNPAAILADQQSRIATYQGYHSGDGVMPVISLEIGQSTNGSRLDPGWMQQIATTYSDPKLSGASAWAWDNWGAPGLYNSLTYNPGTSLTPYGAKVMPYVESP